MEIRRIGIAMNGVTGRMGTNQHLIRSVLAIIKQGGVRVSPSLTLMPDPVLLGRNADKLKALAEAHGPDAIGKPLDYTTDIDAAIADDRCEVFFDASGTLQRIGFLEKAIAKGRHVYCEKPTATRTHEALAIAQVAEDAGVKNGVVQDKLWLPGIRRLRALIDQGFFGKILSVRGEFGYWVFSGMYPDQPPQRPSWNYREADGGGIMIDMFCHWQYVLEGLFADNAGPVTKLVSWAATDLDKRVDETGETYAATADDSAYAIFLLGDRVPAQFNSSWCTRVRRDDLL
ncbi:MAG: Gfo/Idh/MocA family oxidoreductase, partial [Planctomycetota bacterium]